MTPSITSHDLDPLKGQLRELLPHARSSHRTEALARGLRFSSNAALLVGLSTGPIECEVDTRAFVDFLTSRDVDDVPWDTLAEAIVRVKFPDQRAAIAAVMDQEPTLGARGYKTWNPRQTTRENADDFRANRAEMLEPHSIADFMRAIAFLETKEKSRTVSRKATSYGYKHQAERHHRDLKPGANPYVANGLFIAAAIHLGFMVKREGSGPNAYINIAAPPTVRDRSLAGSMRGEARQAAWRNMMVAGINAGIKHGLFGVSVEDNRWEGDEVIYRFIFDGLPAIACARDIGSSELAVQVALLPTERAEEFIRSYNGGFLVGEAFASGWFEREEGAWLQSPSAPTGCIRNAILDRVANTSQSPLGYADRGKAM